MIAPTRPVLRYHGGKWKLAPWIIAQLPPHRIYVEPYGGGASVLLRKPPAYSEVYNDLWGTVVNVFRVLRDPVQAAELERALRLTPYARDEFNLYQSPGLPPVELARRTIFHSFAGHGSAAVNGDRPTGFRANAKVTGSSPSRQWATFHRHVASFTERLRGVVIENKPALEVIRLQDSRRTLFYVDPPYPQSTRNMDRGNAEYAYEMTDDDHRQLAAALRHVRGMVVLSGYPCALYDGELYPDWQRIERAAHADGARDRIEVLWINPAAQRARLPLFAQETQ